MKKYKKAALNIAILTIFLSTGITNSYLLFSNQASEVDVEISKQKITNIKKEKKEDIINAFEKNDFLVWKKLIGENNKINNIVNEDIFNNFIIARNAARNGDYDRAIKLTENLKTTLLNQIS